MTHPHFLNHHHHPSPSVNRGHLTKPASTGLVRALLASALWLTLAVMPVSGQAPQSNAGRVPPEASDPSSPLVSVDLVGGAASLPATVMVTQDKDSRTFQLQIDNQSPITCATWLEVEKAAISRLPGRAIRFVDAQGHQVGFAPRTMIGIIMEPASGAVAYQVGVDDGTALLVNDVQPGLPAAKAGIRRYDVILSCNGQKPLTNERFAQILMLKAPGDSLNLVLARGGQTLEFAIRLAAYDPVAMEKVRKNNTTADPGALLVQARDGLQAIKDSLGSGTPQVVKDAADQGQHDILVGLPPIPNPSQTQLATIRTKLDGIQEQLRRMEQVLEAILQIEAQRQPGGAGRPPTSSSQ